MDYLDVRSHGMLIYVCQTWFWGLQYQIKVENSEDFCISLPQMEMYIER